MAGLIKFPTAEVDFDIFINNIIPYFNTNKARLIVTAAAQAYLTKLLGYLNTPLTGWNALYMPSVNPAESTVTIVQERMTLRVDITEALRELIDDIPKSLLTPTDIVMLSLSIRANKYSRATIPKAIPNLSIVKRGHLYADIKILDGTHMHVLSKLANADSIELDGAFLQPGVAVSPTFPAEADYRHIATTGRCKYRRSYADNQIRGTEYLRARYINSRNVAGTWSEHIAVVIS